MQANEMKKMAVEEANRDTFMNELRQKMDNMTPREKQALKKQQMLNHTGQQLDEVSRLSALQGAEINHAKIILANYATTLCHGEAAAAQAEPENNQAKDSAGLDQGSLRPSKTKKRNNGEAAAARPEEPLRRRTRRCA